MSILSRRVRAALVFAGMWAAGWACLGAAFRVVWPTESGLEFPTLTMILSSGASWIVPGAIAGSVFAVGLTLGRRSRPEEYSPLRLSLSGSTAAIVVPSLVFLDATLMTGRSYLGVLPLVLQYAVAGGLCATGSFFLARRARDLGSLHQMT